MNNDIRKICSALLRDIISGALPPGSVVPKEVELGKQFDTTRMNAQRAVSQLASMGFVTRRKHTGTRVCDVPDMEALSEALKILNRRVVVLSSGTPHWIHWDNSSFSALEEILSNEGYHVMYRNIPVDLSRRSYRAVLDEISKDGASSLVIFPDVEDNAFLLKNGDLLLDFKMPVYMLNRSGEPMALDMVSYVSADPFGDGVKVGTLLRKNACRNIVMLNPEGSFFWAQKRYQGIAMSLRMNGSREISLEEINGFGEFSKVFSRIRSGRKPVTVVAVNNVFAAKFIDAAKEEGLMVSEDYTLIAFDDNPLYHSYNLTSMAMPFAEIGRLFGRMICDQSWIRALEGKLSLKVNSSLIVRETFRPKLVGNESFSHSSERKKNI